MNRKIKNGRTWGDWRLVTDHLVLERNGKQLYVMDLREITGSAEMLDWIFQLRIKSWATNDIIGDLVSAFQDIFDPQANLCGGGYDHHLDASAYLAEVIAD